MLYFRIYLILNQLSRYTKQSYLHYALIKITELIIKYIEELILLKKIILQVDITGNTKEIEEKGVK